MAVMPTEVSNHRSQQTRRPSSWQRRRMRSAGVSPPTFNQLDVDPLHPGSRQAFEPARRSAPIRPPPPALGILPAPAMPSMSSLRSGLFDHSTFVLHQGFDQLPGVVTRPAGVGVHQQAHVRRACGWRPGGLRSSSTTQLDFDNPIPRHFTGLGAPFPAGIDGNGKRSGHGCGCGSPSSS
jgi:hypothetical protein